MKKTVLLVLVVCLSFAAFGPAFAETVATEVPAAEKPAAEMTAEELYQAGQDALDTEDYGKALEYYQLAADAGNPEGWRGIGSMYEFGDAVPDSKPEIRFNADIINNQFAIQIENSCLSVSFAAGFQKGNCAGEEWLPADAFRSTHGGGYGLKRMEMIAGKYGGNAWFSFDAKNRVFVTRLMLPVSEV